MAGWIDVLWQTPEPVEFESAFGFDDSVARLRAATRRSVFSALARQEAVGPVTATKVSLQRVIPMVGNSFKPVFRGRFIERGDKVVLVGKFAMFWPVRLFMAVWFGGAAGATLVAAFAALTGSCVSAWAPLGGIGMIAFGIALVAFGRWLARNDEAWLSAVIAGALSGESSGAAGTGETAVEQAPVTGSRPGVIVAAAAGLALMGVLLGVGAVTGISAFQAGPGGVAIAHFAGIGGRLVAGFVGVMVLILAYGVYRRRILAWRAGFVLLAGSWVYTAATIFTTGGMPPGHGLEIAFAVISLLVVAYWARWWYAQRVHFHE